MFAALLAVLPLVLKWLPGGVLEPILGHLEKKADTETERLRLQVQKEIAFRQAQRDVLIAEQGRWFTALIRPMFAWPLAIWWAKVILVDKVLGMGSTDPLTGQVGEWAGLIVGAYFLAEA